MNTRFTQAKATDCGGDDWCGFNDFPHQTVNAGYVISRAFEPHSKEGCVNFPCHD
jgi:hypothetical protein